MHLYNLQINRNVKDTRSRKKYDLQNLYGRVVAMILTSFFFQDGSAGLGVPRSETDFTTTGQFMRLTIIIIITKLVTVSL